MLQIKNITKTYQTEGFKQTALSGVSLNFRDCEFASILGPSGSGKTTLLNIIGGLDKYTSGDLVINGISTKKFKNADWDSYRNHRIGFVFQSYNLISHQSVLNNVKLALTLSGISKKEATRRAADALKMVGLTDHMNKRPNQMSGGQMQRVAIARALVNDPDILLADEPTGALDSETSVQIMDLLKEISKTKLVIMVTHNPDLAKEYSSRIITLKDGKITGDSNPLADQEAQKEEISAQALAALSKEKAAKPKKDKNKRGDGKSKKTSMSFLTALSLSFNNLMTKKARTVLVAFAGSIGIIGIALIMAVSTGFQAYVDSIQEDTLTSYPLTIMQESTDIAGTLLALRAGGGAQNGTETVKEQQFLTSMLGNIKANDLKSFKKYFETNKQKLGDGINNVKYSYSIDPMIYTVDATNSLAKLNPSNLFSSIYGSSMLSSYSSIASIYSQMIDNQDVINEQYNVLKGRMPQNYDEMIIVLSEPNSISDLLVYSLGLRDTKELTTLVSSVMSGKGAEINNEPMELTYDDLLNIDLRLILPSDTYVYNQKYGVYEDMSDNKDYMQKLYDGAARLKIVGILSPKEGATSKALDPGVAYTSALVDHIIDSSANSEAVKKQLADQETDVFSGKKFDSEC
ncbi:MAG: ABC transporter ATP-binding protein, partial [Oscillospiraceae bacterium]|nr:ABC transporter ATP-binding protein [Candidatus Equicaccousia limihippi]